MTISKIKGQILSDNLQRSGVNLAVETDLLFFDVTNDRIGINDGTPSDSLSVTGTTGLTGTLTVSGNSTLATAKISDLTSGRIVYAGTAGELQDNANLTFDGTTLTIDNISAETGNSLTISADTNINLTADDNSNGTGLVTVTGTSGLKIPAGTTAQRPTGIASGTIRFNTSNGNTEIYNGAGWETIGDNIVSITSQTINGDDTTTAFTLSESATTTSVIVSINGVLQVPSVAYSVSGGTTITFTEAPASTDRVEVRFISNITTVSSITNVAGTTYLEVQGTTISAVVEGTTVAEIASDEIVNISNAHSLQLPVYTSAEANALSNKATGQIAYISNGDGGNPTLSFYNGALWVHISTAENIEDTVGAMFSGNTESGILATYQDAAGKIDLDVNDPTIELTGAVTGSAVMSNLGNVSITTTATNDPTLTLSGDVSGSATFTNLGNATLSVTVADNSHNHVVSNVDGLQTALDGKTTESYVDTQITNLIGGAPGALDTLNELAASINDDSSYASTVTTALGGKVAKAGDTLTGKLTLDGDPVSNLHAATKQYVDTATSGGNITLGTDTSGNYIASGTTSGNGISGSVSSEGGTFTVTSNATTANTANTIVFRDASGNFNAGTMSGTATTAQYADLAENYTSDKQYTPGTVVMLGGDAEVTECNEFACTRVAGVVSTNPAYLMNSGVEDMHVAVALMGRVACNVIGIINKGDLIVSSSTLGFAEAWTDIETDPRAGSIIGKSLESKTTSEPNSVEIIVGLK